MMAAIAAGLSGKKVILLEKNEKTGKKLYITGKGRCNITNMCDRDTFFENVVTNPRFLFSSFACFNNYDMFDLLESHGLRLKVERGNRCFPESDKSSDVIKTLNNAMRELGVDVRLNTKVKDICTKEEGGKKCVMGVRTQKDFIPASSVIVATGGLSYPSTGSDGDGYRFAAQAGHSVTKLYPSLVAFSCADPICRDMAGLTLKNISIKVLPPEGDRVLYEDFGELLFTHTGVSGPVILSASAFIGAALKTGSKLVIDMKPAVDKKELDERLIRELSVAPAKSFSGAAGGFLPAKLLAHVIERAGIDPTKKAGSVTRAEREEFIAGLKSIVLTIQGTMGYNEAVVTGGGVDVREISPKTMESKLVKGLYFAGEVIDVDAYTGGFNLQVAWSTGYAAGSNAEE